MYETGQPDSSGQRWAPSADTTRGDSDERTPWAPPPPTGRAAPDPTEAPRLRNTGDILRNAERTVRYTDEILRSATEERLANGPDSSINGAPPPPWYHQLAPGPTPQGRVVPAAALTAASLRDEPEPPRVNGHAPVIETFPPTAGPSRGRGGAVSLPPAPPSPSPANGTPFPPRVENGRGAAALPPGTENGRGTGSLSGADNGRGVGSLSSGVDNGRGAGALSSGVDNGRGAASLSSGVENGRGTASPPSDAENGRGRASVSRPSGGENGHGHVAGESFPPGASPQRAAPPGAVPQRAGPSGAGSHGASNGRGAGAGEPFPVRAEVRGENGRAGPGSSRTENGHGRSAEPYGAGYPAAGLSSGGAGPATPAAGTPRPAQSSEVTPRHGLGLGAAGAIRVPGAPPAPDPSATWNPSPAWPGAPTTAAGLPQRRPAINRDARAAARHRPPSYLPDPASEGRHGQPGTAPESTTRGTHRSDSPSAGFPPSAGAADPARLREAAPARSAAQVRSSGPVEAEPFGAGEPVAAGLSGLDGSELARIATHLRRSRSGEPVRLDVSAVLEAVRDVAGVRDAAVREEPGGGPTLRLDLTEGADPRHVGQQVARLLGERLGVGADLAGGARGGVGTPTAETPLVSVRSRAGGVLTTDNESRTARGPGWTSLRRDSDTQAPGAPEPAGLTETRRVTRSRADLSGPGTGLGISGTGRRTGADTDEDADPAPRQRPEVPAGSRHRAALEQVRVTTGGLEATVEVTLAYDGVRVIGRASGPAVDSHVLRLSAAATANAVEILLSGRGRCAVEYAALVPAGTVDTALVVLLLLAGGWAEQLVGTALAVGDPRQAVARATLDALNRRVDAMMS